MPDAIPCFRIVCKLTPIPEPIPVACKTQPTHVGFLPTHVGFPATRPVFGSSGAAAACITSGLSHPFPQLPQPPYYVQAHSKPAPYPPVSYSLASPVYYSLANCPPASPPVPYPLPSYFTAPVMPYPAAPHPQSYPVVNLQNELPKQEPILIDLTRGDKLGLSITKHEHSKKWVVRISELKGNELHSSLRQYQDLFQSGIPLDDIRSTPPLSSITIHSNGATSSLYEYLKKFTTEVTAPAPPPVATAAPARLKGILKPATTRS